MNNTKNLLSFSAPTNDMPLHNNENANSIGTKDIQSVKPCSIPVYAKVNSRSNRSSKFKRKIHIICDYRIIPYFYDTLTHILIFLASTAEYVTISQETLRNGSSSIIGIGPGQSLQQRENPATNQYFGSLQRPNNNISLQTQVNSICQNSSTKTLPMNPHLNRFNNLNQPNGMIHSNNYTAIPLTPNQQGNLNKTISLNNSASSQTPTPPPPEMTVKQLPTSQSTFSGMGTHV